MVRLIVLSGQTLLITPSITCSFAATYNLNFPRPAPIWPCSSVGRALVICSGGREFESQRGQRFFLFDPVGPFPFWGHRSEGRVWDFYWSSSAKRPNFTGYPFTLGLCSYCWFSLV